MDLNLMSCPTCGHSVNNTSGTCAYCGALMTEDQQPPTEETEAAANSQSVESPPPSIEPDATASADDSDPAIETLAPTQDQSKSFGSQELTELMPDADAANEETDSKAGVEKKQALTDIEGQPTSIEAQPELRASTEVESQPGEAALQLTEDLGTKSVADTDEQVVWDDPVVESDPNTANDEAMGPGSNEAQTDSSLAEVEPIPVPNQVDSPPNEPVEADKSGENIIELAEIPDIQEELEKTSIPETSAPLDKLDEPSHSDSPEALQPESEADTPTDTESSLTTESLGDTILLDISDEVQPEAEKVPPKGDNSAQSPAAEALKIEKAAQDLTAAVNKQRASIAETQTKIEQEAASTKAEAVKKQKAALAKSRAIKKQKMILAKAAALKRKKAAQAKAQALKKQEAARAGIENASKDEVAATITAGAVKNKPAKDPETSSELKKLLEKYKGQAVGINYDNSADIREAQLVEANSEYFSVQIKEKNLQYSYPLKTILTVIEGEDGVEAGEPEKKSKFNAVIKLYPLVLF